MNLFAKQVQAGALRCATLFGVLLAAEAAWAQTPATVRSVKGSAYYRETDGAWKPLKAGQPVNTGTVIRTGATCLACYELVLVQNNSVLRVKSESTSSLARMVFDAGKSGAAAGPLLPLQRGQIFAGLNAPSPDPGFAEFVVHASGVIQVDAGTLQVAYLSPAKNKPVQVTIGPGDAFEPPATLPAGPAGAPPVPSSPRFPHHEPVYEVTVMPSKSSAAGIGAAVTSQIDVRVAIISP